MSQNFRSWLERLPRGGKVLLAITAAVIGGAILFVSGARIGGAASDLTSAQDQEIARG